MRFRDTQGFMTMGKRNYFKISHTKQRVYKRVGYVWMRHSIIGLEAFPTFIDLCILNHNEPRRQRVR